VHFPVLTVEQITVFIFTFLRVSAIIVMVPAFGEQSVPAQVKGGLALIIAIILFPLLRYNPPAIVSTDTVALILGMAGEIMIGVVIGFAARCIFAGVQSAGELTGFQMGFSMAYVLDPMTSTQVSVLAEFQYIFAMLIFLIVDAHHLFLSALVESFRIIPPLGFTFSGSLMQVLFVMSKNVFIIALKLSAPIVAVMIFTNIGLGVVARTVPQINIFVVGFPLQIAVGFIFLGLTAPLFAKIMAAMFGNIMGEIRLVLSLM